MWCQVEIETDGGILGRISPFVAMSLVPQMTPYNNKEGDPKWTALKVSV